MFMKALDAMGKLDDPFFGNIPPDETVKLVFNLSQDEDVRGPWNEEPDFEYVADPQPEGGLPPPPINADDEGHDSRSPKPRKKRVARCNDVCRLAGIGRLRESGLPSRVMTFMSGTICRLARP